MRARAVRGAMAYAGVVSAEMEAEAARRWSVLLLVASAIRASERGRGVVKDLCTSPDFGPRPELGRARSDRTGRRTPCARTFSPMARHCSGAADGAMGFVTAGTVFGMRRRAALWPSPRSLLLRSGAETGAGAQNSKTRHTTNRRARGEPGAVHLAYTWSLERPLPRSRQRQYCAKR